MRTLEADKVWSLSSQTLNKRRPSVESIVTVSSQSSVNSLEHHHEIRVAAIQLFERCADVSFDAPHPWPVASLRSVRRASITTASGDGQHATRSASANDAEPKVGPPTREAMAEMAHGALAQRGRVVSPSQRAAWQHLAAPSWRQGRRTAAPPPPASVSSKGSKSSSKSSNKWVHVPMHARFTETYAMQRAAHIARFSERAKEANALWQRRMACMRAEAERAARTRHQREKAEYERERARAERLAARISGLHISAYDQQFLPRAFASPQQKEAEQLVQVL